VFIVKDGRAQWTYITPGRSNGRETEVLPDSSSGQIPVHPGDAIIVDGQLTLTHDAPVKVTPAGDAMSRDAQTRDATSRDATSRDAPKSGKSSKGSASRASGTRP
jgi:hypothetical protein